LLARRRKIRPNLGPPGSSAPLESAAQSAISVTFYLQNPV
jgi:hypothetical protein